MQCFEQIRIDFKNSGIHIIKEENGFLWHIQNVRIKFSVRCCGNWGLKFYHLDFFSTGFGMLSFEYEGGNRFPLIKIIL